jgi:DnaJ-class molecular chaperone
MKKPITTPLEYKCPECMGAGYASIAHPRRPGVRIYTECKECKGKGRIAAN